MAPKFVPGGVLSYPTPGVISCRQCVCVWYSVYLIPRVFYMLPLVCHMALACTSHRCMMPVVRAIQTRRVHFETTPGVHYDTPTFLL